MFKKKCEVVPYEVRKKMKNGNERKDLILKSYIDIKGVNWKFLRQNLEY